MVSIPKELIKHSHNGADFRSNAKKYVINMTSYKKKMHIFNNKSCRDSQFLYDYLDFDNMNEAKIFFEKYEKDFSKCDKCFPQK